MPTWRVHIFMGICITALFVYVITLIDLWYLFIKDNQIQFLFWFHAGFICILGSLLPDYDYRKTKIRHALGPVLGLFIIMSYVYLNLSDLSNIDLDLFLILLFAFFIIPSFFGFVFPFRHHGKMHSFSAAVLYVLIWMLLELLVFQMTPLQSGIIGLFGFIGYSSHLLLDLDLKLY